MRKSSKLAAAAACAASLAMLAAPRVARAWKAWQESRRAAWIAASVAALQRGEETLPPMPFGMETEPGRSGVERDDPNMRRLVDLLIEGPRTPAYRHQLMVLAAAENAKAKALLQQRKAFAAQGRPVGAATAAATPATTLSWDSLGPANTHVEYNGASYQANDTGRPTAIRVDPADPNVVYVAVSGGGLWKATNFTTGQPDWKPLTDGLGVLALGAMDIDPADHLTLYIGTGDAFDQQGGSVVKSTDGGVTWGAPVQLVATTQVFGPVAAGSIRSIAVDPANSLVVLAATDTGLFRSADGGATFTWIDLPNPAGYLWGGSLGATDFDLEAAWDVVWLGASSFMVSGSYACPGDLAPPAGFSQVGCVDHGLGVAPPPGGNLGDLWVSADDGLTWTSARMAGKLPTQAAAWGTGDSAGLGDVGRIALGAASNANPALATVYAEAGSVDEVNSRTVLLFGTRDGGGTWSKLGTPLSTNLSNPTSTVTLPDGTTENDCGTLDLGHGQSWYNLAVGVDPANPDHAIAGGNLCSVRTLDGGATWQNASHWLPAAGIGNTQDGAGALPYVHADWHTVTVAGSTVLAGTDGGIFTSSDVFSAARTQLASWLFPDVGLVTHLAYAHATGDPVRGNAQVLYAGFQDNGTRYRLPHPETLGIAEAARTFDQVIGGDGIGCAVATDANGENAVYWASVEFGRLFCRPDEHDCSTPTTGATENWVFASIPVAQMPAGDGEVFLERFSPTYDAQSSVLAATAKYAWKIAVDAADKVTYTRLTSAPLNLQNQSVYASPFTYTVAGKPARIYGIVTSGGKFGAIVDDGSGTFPLTQSATAMQVGGETIFGATSVAFPRDPANLGGSDIRSTYVGTSGNTTDTAGNPVPDALGHIFKTADGGASWTPIHGAGVPAPGGGTMDLPNVSIGVVRFDPGDPTDQTLYVGTDLGLYRTTDGGSTWARYGNLPTVRITDISVSRNGSLLRVSTYGRGLWEIYPHSEAAAAPGNGDWDRNGVIDFLDLAALASRLGTSAGTSVPASPRYDSALDLTGVATQIEDADLSALLGKIGSTP
ncbi:MAG TPA: hypothetical protein VI356_09035 [Myxococcales bacterium]